MNVRAIYGSDPLGGLQLPDQRKYGIGRVFAELVNESELRPIVRRKAVEGRDIENTHSQSSGGSSNCVGWHFSGVIFDSFSERAGLLS